MEQKSHKWIFKVLAKNNARVSLLDTFFLKSGTLEFLIYTDSDGSTRQKLPRDLQYRNLGDLFISLKKEFKAFQKVSNIGKYACILVGRNLKLKLDLAGLKEYRNRVQTFPLLQYLQKIKPHSRSDEGWYNLILTYTDKTYKSEFLWKEIDKEIPSTQRLVFEMAKNIATVIISLVEKEEGDRKRVVKLEMNLTLDDLGVLWLMSCNCTLNLKEEMIGNEAIGNENMQIFDVRSRNRKKTLYKDRNEDSDKPKIIRSDSPIRIKSPNNSNNGPTPRPSEEGPTNHPLTRTLTITSQRLAFGQDQKAINGGMSPEHRRANRSKTTQFAPFSFHAFNYKFFRDAEPCKNSNASLTEESSIGEDEDSLSDGSINVHFLEILGRERCKIKCKVGNPLRNPTPGVEELKQEMRHIRERIKSYEEESAARRNMNRRNSRCIRKNSWIASKKMKPNQIYDNIKRSDSKTYLFQTMKAEDGLLSPLSSLDSPGSPLKLKKIASKSIENGKSKTPKGLPSHNVQPLLNTLHWKANTTTHSPANFKDPTKIISPNPSLPALSKITSHVLQVPKNRKIGFKPVSTYHGRFRSLQT